MGKKSVPASYRRDDWVPFATVALPSGYQALNAFRQLREFRKMHELCWREQMEPGKPLPQRRERMKMLMDQKANSVADLAAVLALQKKKGFEMEAAEGRLEEDVKKRWANMQKLARRAESGELEQLKEAWKKERTIKRLAEKLAKEDASEIAQGERIQAREKLAAMQRTIIAMHQALKAVATATEDPHTPLEILTMDKRPLPRKGRRRKLAKPRPPVMKLDGVTISWADFEDLKFAAAWPEEVEHDVLGIPPDPYKSPSVHTEPVLSLMTEEEYQQRLGEVIAERAQLEVEASEFVWSKPKTPLKDVTKRVTKHVINFMWKQPDGPTDKHQQRLEQFQERIAAHKKKVAMLYRAAPSEAVRDLREAMHMSILHELTNPKVEQRTRRTKPEEPALKVTKSAGQQKTRTVELKEPAPKLAPEPAPAPESAAEAEFAEGGSADNQQQHEAETASITPPQQQEAEVASTPPPQQQSPPQQPKRKQQPPQEQKEQPHPPSGVMGFLRRTFGGGGGGSKDGKD